MCRDLAEVGRFAQLDNWQFRIVRQGVPGSYTFLLPATREVPRRLQHPQRSTIGVRVPDHPVVQALLAELGEPMLSSTLMLPGDERAAERRRAEIRARLGIALDLIIDAGACRRSRRRSSTSRSTRRWSCGSARGDPARLGLVEVRMRPSAPGKRRRRSSW